MPSASLQVRIARMQSCKRKLVFIYHVYRSPTGLAMKRFSSALFVALAALTASVAEPVWAQTPDAAVTKGKLELADNAPDSYTVVKGDTLWGISGKFLKSPWRWPEVWKLNTEQIKNPHWIYPGQVIYLDRNGPNGPTLSLTPPGSSSPYERLSPRVYESPASGAISTVPLQYIQSLLIEPLVTGQCRSGQRWHRHRIAGRSDSRGCQRNNLCAQSHAGPGQLGNLSPRQTDHGPGQRKTGLGL